MIGKLGIKVAVKSAFIWQGCIGPAEARILWLGSFLYSSAEETADEHQEQTTTLVWELK